MVIDDQAVVRQGFIARLNTSLTALDCKMAHPAATTSAPFS